MRFTLALLPVLALTACATPRESCIYTAQNQLRPLENKIQVAQGNVDRGYAISVSKTTQVVRATCTNTLEDGTIERFNCDRTEESTSSLPVAIDVAEERRKVADLRRQLAPLQAAINTSIQQCIAIHPE
jgi:hypothetical protein